jgi:succinyl-CoA synthetase alpha subunit/malate-CoA ligase subunit alpha
MSILIDADTRALVVGISGRIGVAHCRKMLDYGTQVVGGVVPGKGAAEVAGVPVFDTVREAVQQTDASAAIILVPPPFAADSIMESVDAGVRLCIAITDGVPAQDMIRVKRYMKLSYQSRRTRLLGPNCAGVISPGKSLLGVMPGAIYQPGRVGIISRSGTLGYEAAAQLSEAGLGVSTSVGIGGDPITGSSFLDILKLFDSDDDTDLIVLLGEIGGPQEAQAAQYIGDKLNKPVVAYVAGAAAPSGRNMGHAGAIISAFGDSANEKSNLLRDVGATIAPDAASIGVTAAEVLGRQGAAS